MTHLVVHLPFLLVGEDLLCFLGLLELLLGVRVVADVGVVLPCFLPVGLLYLIFGGVPGDPQYLVEILAHSLCEWYWIEILEKNGSPTGRDTSTPAAAVARLRPLHGPRPGRLFFPRETVRPMSVRSDARAAATVERIAVWGVAVLAVAALAGLVVGPGADLRTAAPSADFEGSYDNATGAVTVTHAGGDDLTGESVALVVTDADNDTTTRLLWANESTLPVTEGDSVTVDDPRVDSNGDGNYLDADRSVGFYLEPGDTVDVVWTGRLTGAPETRTETLETITIGDETG